MEQPPFHWSWLDVRCGPGVQMCFDCDYCDAHEEYSTLVREQPQFVLWCKARAKAVAVKLELDRRALRRMTDGVLFAIA